MRTHRTADGIRSEFAHALSIVITFYYYSLVIQTLHPYIRNELYMHRPLIFFFFFVYIHKMYDKK